MQTSLARRVSSGRVGRGQASSGKRPSPGSDPPEISGVGRRLSPIMGKGNLRSAPVHKVHAMEVLQKQVRRAQRRMMLQALTGRLAWCWFATFAVAAGAIGAARYWTVSDLRTWDLAWLTGALVVGVLAALVWTWVCRQDAMAAAVEIDRRFELKERVSSSLALRADEREAPFAAALMQDAQQRLNRIDVAERFRVSLSRKSLLPLIPVAAACAIVLMVEARVPQTAVSAPAAAAVAQVQKPTEALAKKLEQTRKEALERGLPDADLTLKQLEIAAKSLADRKGVDKKQALVELNDLVKGAQQRRQELASGADLKQQFAQLKNMEQGPAQKLAQAMKSGDLTKAQQELEKLSEQLASGQLDEAGKQLLEKQLDEMRSVLEKRSESQRKAEHALAEKIEAERKAGNNAAAEKLQQQLDQLTAKKAQQEKLEQLAAGMKKAGEQLKQGKPKEAAETLAKIAEQFEEMGEKLAEMEMLDQALDQMAEAKSAMACQHCEGEGCEACQADKARDPLGANDLMPGVGIGGNRRGDGKAAASFIDSQVKQSVGRGAGIVTGQADGPNRKGKVQEEIREAYSSAEQQTAEALSGQRLPHDYRDHAKRYFDALREGQARP